MGYSIHIHWSLKILQGLNYHPLTELIFQARLQKDKKIMTFKNLKQKLNCKKMELNLVKMEKNLKIYFLK